MSEFKWSNNLAYAVGLLATDGCLSKDGRHIDLTSKDIEQLENFMLCVGKKRKIGLKTSGFSDKYFFDFLRGSHDGDGCFYSYWDPRWKSSFMYYLQFSSASKKHILWLQEKIKLLLGVQGRINFCSGAYRLVFAKKASNEIIKKMYKKKNCICLSRKKNKIFNALNAAVLELAYRRA